jgi:putative nucleotidyltransferase with HDIG domain
MLDTVRQVASAASVALDPGAMVEALARGLRSVISVAELCLIVVEGTLARVVGVASWQGDRLSVHSGAESVVLTQELRTTLASGQPTAVDLGALGDLALHFEQAEGHLVSIPLTRESKALGGLLVRILGEEPSPEKLAILGHLSEPVGVFTMHVLTNLRLRERLAMHRAMLDLVTSTTSGLPSAEMLSAALDKAKDLLMAKGVGVALLVPARHGLKVVAAHGALSFALGSELPITPDMDAGIFRAGTMWMAEQAGTLWSEGLSGPAAALPCVALPLRTGGRVLGVLFVVPKARGKPDTGMMALMEAVASLVANALFRSSLEHDAEESYLRTVIMLQRMLDARDSYVATHSGIVADVAEALGRQLKLDDLSLKELRLAALLHDIGKVAVPDSILKKAGPLTPDEWDLVREHPLVGGRILSPLRKLGRVAQYVRHHHERWDGTGYPDGLRGEAIPLASRIIAVVDAFFAIVSERSYRPGRSLPDALAELEAGSGTQFDPKVVWAFLRLVRSGQLDIVALVKAHKAAQPPRVR